MARKSILQLQQLKVQVLESGVDPNAGASSSDESTTNAPSEDDVVDADFEVIEDEKADK